MIVFGGLVALLLAWRPRGLLDERCASVEEQDEVAGRA